MEKKTAKKEPKRKLGSTKCKSCDGMAELSPPGRYCASCRKALSLVVRKRLLDFYLERGLNTNIELFQL